MDENSDPSQAAAPVCAICQSPVPPAAARETCPACNGVYHAECWAENGGCAVYGCPQVPETEPRRDVEIPVSYWGKEQKPCPACSAEIMAVARRCRHCGTVFPSARPETPQQFRERRKREFRSPALSRGVVLLFVASVVSMSAPLALLIGLTWYLSRRDEIQALQSPYPALAKLALFVAAGQMLLFALASLLLPD